LARRNSARRRVKAPAKKSRVKASAKNGSKGLSNKEIRAIAMDVDGVLTDGGVWWGPNGEEWKRFHFADIMGLSLAKKAGFSIALISGEDSPLVDRMAAKFSLTDVFKNCKDKPAALRAFAERNRLQLKEICFIGDDVNDIPALQIAGLSACPADARPSVRKQCQYVAKLGGGNGAVREVVDMLLASAGASAKPTSAVGATSAKSGNAKPASAQSNTAQSGT
jgi:3-deoxy-D-manno-octulosonate 8-phosphate phosphatase (KDO 8-P phosphatase)